MPCSRASRSPSSWATMRPPRCTYCRRRTVRPGNRPPPGKSVILIGRLVRSMRRHMRRVSWTAVFVAYLAHLLVTWALLALAGESRLVAPDAYPYYYMTTATTIGYGDLSPSTTAGRYIVAFL